MKNKEFWKTLIQIVVTVLTALGTTLGVTSCIERSEPIRFAPLLVYRRMFPFYFLYFTPML